MAAPQDSGRREGIATEADVRRLLGRLDAAGVSAVLALKPSLGDVELAAAWLAGDGDLAAKAGRPLSGTAAAISDIAAPDEDDRDVR